MTDHGLDDAGDGKTGRASNQCGKTDQAAWPDPQKLAQDWITLWQSELAAIAADPEIRESWQTVMTLWAGTISLMLRGLPTAERHDGPSGCTRADDAPRATTADAASDARDAELQRLARHVAVLERRLADLERGNHSPIHPESRP